MAEERELKFPVEELESHRRRIEELGGKIEHSRALERNWIFDRSGELQALDSALRLRIDGRGVRVTLKGPVSYDGGLKIREETEFSVSDADAARELLERLGYEPMAFYEKEREEWHLDGVHIAVDHTPIGDFLELESGDAIGLARRMGFDPETAEPRSYLRLYLDYRAEHPEAPRDMRFP